MAEVTGTPASGESAQPAAAEAVIEAGPAAPPAAVAKEARAPIIWTGRAKEAMPAAAPEPAAAPPEAAVVAAAEALRPAQRLKPNAAFLLNVVADAERGNQRRCAEDATAVSLSVLEKAVAAGVRPQLARTAEAGEPAVRRAVLSVAQQQRLAACSALLREIALSYGFALHIAEDVGDEDAGGNGFDVAGSQETGGAAAPSEAPASNGQNRPGFRALQRLNVSLDLTLRRPTASSPDLAHEVAAEDAAVPGSAHRSPAERAPGISVAATRLAGVALGAMGSPLLARPAAHRPSRLAQAGAPVTKAAHLKGNASDSRGDEEMDAWYQGAESDEGQQVGEDAEEEASAGSMLEDPGHILLNGRLVPQKEANPAGAGSKVMALPVAATRQMGLLSRAAQMQPSASAHLMGTAMSVAGPAKAARAAQKRMQKPDETAAAQSAGLREGSASSSRSSSEGREDANEGQRVGVKQTLAQRLGPSAQDASMAPAAKRLRLNKAHAASSEPRVASGREQHALPSHATGVGDAGPHIQQPAQQQAGTSLARLLTRATAAAAAAGSAKGADAGRNGSAAALERAESRDAAAAKGVMTARVASGHLRRNAFPGEEAQEGNGAGQGRRASGVNDEQQVQGVPKKAAAKAGGAARGLFGAAMAGISMPRQGKNVLT